MNFLIPMLGVLALLQEPREPLSDEQKRVFETIDKLDPVDTSKLPFVRVFSGQIDRDHPDGPRSYSYVGFLLKDDGDTFTLRYLDLDTTIFTRSVKGTPDLERVRHEKED